MATAFQATAFQNNAFQIDGTPPVVVVVDTHDDLKRRKKHYDKEREAARLRRKQIEDAWELIVEGRPQVVEAAVQEIAPKSKQPVQYVLAEKPNFTKLLSDAERLDRIWKAYLELDDEEVMLLI